MRAPDETGRISVASAVSSALHSRPRPPLFEVPEVPPVASQADGTADAATVTDALADEAEQDADQPPVDSTQDSLPLPLPSERPDA